MKKEYQIDLDKFRTPTSKVFTGRDRGKSVRKESKIDTLIDEYELIVISIPEYVRSINPSFLEEFLLNIVTKLGTEKTNEKIKFISLGRYNIESDLKESIERINRNSTAIG